ncbi:hypothetical protein [Lysobacter gummosus]
MTARAKPRRACCENKPPARVIGASRSPGRYGSCPANACCPRRCCPC